VDPSVNELEGVYLYDIDSLQLVAQQSLAQRRRQVAAAEEIIAQHVADFGEQISRGFDWRACAVADPPIGDTSLRTSES
jgi:glutamyl-tRNA reductase